MVVPISGWDDVHFVHHQSASDSNESPNPQAAQVTGEHVPAADDATDEGPKGDVAGGQSEEEVVQSHLAQLLTDNATDSAPNRHASQHHKHRSVHVGEPEDESAGLTRQGSASSQRRRALALLGVDRRKVVRHRFLSRRERRIEV